MKNEDSKLQMLFSLVIGFGLGLVVNQVSNYPVVSWSLIAAIILILIARALYKKLISMISLIKGVKYTENNRELYCRKVSELITTSRRFIFIKVFTGFDILTHELVKKALNELSGNHYVEVDIVFTHPDSDAYKTELNKKYDQKHLQNLHDAALDSVKANLRRTHNSYYLHENRCLLMLAANESVAYIFFRGFNSFHASDGIILFEVRLEKTYPMLNNLILFLKDFFIQQSEISRG